MSEQMQILGLVKLKVWRPDRTIKHQQTLKNLVTSAGLLLAAKRLGGVAADPVLYMAIGSGSTSPALAQTALIGTEHERVLATAGAAGAILTLEATLGSSLSAIVTVKELGTFNAAAAGVMFSRITPVEFELDPGETLDVVWELLFQ